MKIDAHHHFWDYDPAQYEWIGEGMDTLKHSFGPADLRGEIAKAGIDGVISVQARTSLRENDFLLDLADRHDFIKGVVGYVDLTRADAGEQLARFAARNKASGVREVLQGLPDDRYCLREDFNRGVAGLHSFGLTYDILIFHRHLRHAIEFVDRHPLQLFILDHVAKPEIRTPQPAADWVANMKELGRRENVYCKVSGMVTEVPREAEWTSGLLKPYFETAWETFGAKRVMFGSDWPVCLLRSGYGKWRDTVDGWTRQLSEPEQAAFWGENAARAYSLKV